MIKYNISLISLLTILILLKYIKTAAHDTKMIIRLARHGARSPVKHQNELGIEWPGLKQDFDYGELIPAGYHQHYLSGLNIVERYENLFKKKLEHDEYYLRTTS